MLSMDSIALSDNNRKKRDPGDSNAVWSDRLLDEKFSYLTFGDRGSPANHEYLVDIPSSSITRRATQAMSMRRLVLVSIAAGALLIWIWRWYFRPHWTDRQTSLDDFLRTANNSYSPTKAKDFDGTRIADLGPDLIPGGDDDPHAVRRLIFVGDIHGCADNLRSLLKAAEFEPQTDHLIAVGDVISKGPDNVGVLDQLMSLNASSVRGNHEDRILALAPAVLGSELVRDSDSPSGTFAKDSALLKELSSDHLKYLRGMPLMLRIPPLPLSAGTSSKKSSPIGEEILVVHAGLVPALRLDRQDPYYVMNMRAIHTKTLLPTVEAESKKARSKPWHDLWCWYNERLFKHKSLKDFRTIATDTTKSNDFFETGWLDWLRSGSTKKHPEPQVVVYGHRSKEGLQLERWTKGLDTGCVSGGKLTAWVLDAKGRHHVVQVPCEDQRT